ncbi:hypothetical protein ACHHYP_07975 [Achlya hypogyna]|uniref:C2H2-type domain-containing protein n=1 Tax=Achlya hypogyna TaxID=1202772 RepID=A0A1V9YQ46_ACHHY|nr:hypothetical protein ACHHYP_07975 [Achlya hypogyna]
MPPAMLVPPDPPPLGAFDGLDFDLSFSPAVTPDFSPTSALLLEPLDLLELDARPPPTPPSAPAPHPAAAKRPRLRNFLCAHPGCGKSFADNAHLKDHMFVHTGEKSLRCPECDKCFARVASLRSHRRVHTGERPFLCPEADCDKQYASRAALRMHAAIHASAAKKHVLKKTATASPLKKKKAGCDDCSDCHRGRCRRLADKIKEQRQVILDLQAQLATNSSSSAAPSPTKKKAVLPASKPKSPLLVPMVAPLYLLQDGIKPFKCMLGCGRVFSNYFQLAFHAKQHPEADPVDVLGDQLPFPVGPKYCPVKGCEFSEESGKSMKTLQIVKRHWQRVHQTARPFLCPDCPSHAQKAFKTRDNLTAHRKECKKRATTDAAVDVDVKASPTKRPRLSSTTTSHSPSPRKRTKTAT